MQIRLKETGLSVGLICLLTIICLLTVLSGIASADNFFYDDDFNSHESDTFPSSEDWNSEYYSDYEEVKFRGKVLEARPPASYYSFEVKINEILNDPAGKLKIGDAISVTGNQKGPARVDTVTEGDEVEVFGEYQGDRVYLSDFGDSSSKYYLIRIESTQEAPMPEITSVRIDPSNGVSEDETASIKVSVKNNAGKSSEGYIYVSLPNNEEIINAKGSNRNVKTYPAGSELWGKDGKIASSDHPLIELQENDWEEGQEETLTLEVKPNDGSDEIVFLVRTALKNDETGEYERDPASSDEVDQQGWYVDKYLVSVIKEEEEEEDEEKEEAKKLQFKGVLENIVFMDSQNTAYIVNVKEIVFDPGNSINVGDSVRIWLHNESSASVDIVEAGDYIEVRSTGLELVNSDDFIKKIDLNKPPEIVSINANPAEVVTGGSSTITVVASDPDNDSLTYAYKPRGGKINGSGNVVTWTPDAAAQGAPPATGKFIVDVTVSDGKENVTGSVEVNVTPGPVEKYALIIGIDKYEESENLFCSINNANGISNLLTLGYGYDASSGNVEKLLNEAATAENTMAKLKDFRSKTDKNDIFVFYFSGHGELDKDTGEEFIIFSNEATLSDLDLNEVFSEFEGTVIAIFDCNYSGGMAAETDADYPSGTKNGIEGDNKVIIMSCEAGKEQCTAPPQVIGHTSFTSNFYSAFTTARGESNSKIQKDKISLEEAFNYAKQKTSGESKDVPACYQNPQMMDHFPAKSNNTDQCYFSQSSISPDLLTAQTDYSVHLHAYDSEGRHTGVTTEGNEIEEEIPGSFYNGPSYASEEIIIWGSPEKIRYEIKAFEKGTFNFTIKKSTDDKLTKIKYENIAITPNTTATLLLDNSSPKYLIQIDDDTDGIEDRTEEPDEITIIKGGNQEYLEENTYEDSDSEENTLEENTSEENTSEESTSGDNSSSSSENSSESSSSGSPSSSSGSSSTSSSSSGGGGTGGSPEPASNVEVKELSQQYITNGKHVKFIFPKNVTCITYVEFDPKRTAGKTTTIVEMLKEKSTLVHELPSGKVYENVNIWVGNEGTASPENIENAVVGFRVEKSWLDSSGADASSIRLWRFEAEKWGELSTNQTGEDENYIYFEADTPGFSPFSISALSVETEVSVNEGESSVVRAAETMDNTAEISGKTSKAEENISHSSKASTVEESESDIARSIKKVLLVISLLLATALLGILVLRHED